MPRDLPIGNGSLLVNFDRNYDIRDIYYPNVGSFQHTLGHRSRTGIWSEGHFSWLSSSEWKKPLLYQDDTLATHIVAMNQQIGISVKINDLVDYQENALFRKFEIENLTNHPRRIRIYISHDLHISESQVGDTAYYDPKVKSIIHYKRNQYFLINSLCGGNYGVSKYAVGLQDLKNSEGTWRDAEDGVLSGDAIADGSVDSTIGISLSISENGKAEAYCWMIAGKDYDEVKSINDLIQNKTPKYFIDRTINYWKSWLEQKTKVIQSLKAKNGNPDTQVMLTEGMYNLYKRSLLILQTQIDRGGAITAGNDWDTADTGMDKYSYMWPRDGAIISYALDKAGCREITERFFRFCAKVINPDGYFMHKYHPDGTLGSTWHPYISNGQKQLPIQEDGTALVVWAFYHHFQKYGDVDLLGELYESLVVTPSDFMASYRDKTTGLPFPSYDLWEERYGIHTYTVSAIYAGLLAGASLAKVMGDIDNSHKYKTASDEIKNSMDEYLYDEEQDCFARMITGESDEFNKDFTPDSSLYGTFAFGAYDADDPRVVSTMDLIRGELAVKTEIGGIARYKRDYLHRVNEDFDNVPGNPWFICNLWMAQYLIAKAKTISELNEAITILRWVSNHAFESGVLPEQLNPYNGQPLSISPLSWSHGEFIITIHNFLEKLNLVNQLQK